MNRLLQWLLRCTLLCGALNASAADSMTNPTSIDPRLLQVFAQLQAGKTIKVAAIGGSITTGYASSEPELNGWAAQVGRWLDTQAKAHGGHVEFSNLGLS